VGRDAEIRIGDVERGDARALLDIHLSYGRLSVAEHEERCARAWEARTRGELEALFTDLPAPHPDLSSAKRPADEVAVAEPKPAPPKKKPVRVDTPASSAFGAVAGLSVLLGIPGAILLTIFAGAWWVFIPVGLLIVIAGSISDSLKKPASGT
jgi:hypothetical protein